MTVEKVINYIFYIWDQLISIFDTFTIPITYDYSMSLWEMFLGVFVVSVLLYYLYLWISGG